MLKTAGFVFFLGFVNKGLLAAMVAVKPESMVVLPGQRATFNCSVNVPLQYCRIEIPGFKTYNLNVNSVNDDVSYEGLGLAAGHCGFTIGRVQEKNNGIIKCSLGIHSDATESVGTMTLVVAKAPRVPELQIRPGSDSPRMYKVDERLDASCVVRDGRPAANISWFLDDDPISDISLSMPTIKGFAKEDLLTKIQNFSKTLRASDNGRYLRCVAYHPAYPTGSEETKVLLDITFPPQESTDQLDKFGYQIGKEGLINVTFMANPKPQIQWQIGAEIIKEGESDSSGRIIAESVQSLGRGQYLANMRIAGINKRDTEKEYILTAYNNQGSETYKIRISTSPEPEGVDWAETGSIVGAVVAVLIIILLVSILIFAKTTGRWCFSDSGDLRNLAESSDTESADVRPRETKLSIPPINLSSLFKKNKDKVASEEEPPARSIDSEEEKPTEPESEEDTSEQPKTETKKDLVYAELDLVRTEMKPVVKKEDEKTEYAEIVYTPNPSTETQEEDDEPETK